MKLFIKQLLSFVLSAFCASALAQVTPLPSKCDNLDFSRGDFTNWVGHTSVYPPATPGTNLGVAYYYNTGIVPGRQTIMSASTPDPYACGNVNTLPPGQPFCARLGNGGIGPWGNGVEWQRDYLSYSMVISPTNSLLTYKYAVILQDPNNDPTNPPHPPPLRPRFIVSVLDSAGNVLDPVCGYFNVVVDSTVTGFRNCTLANITAGGGNPSSPAGTIYRAWTTVGVDMRPYMNRNVTLQFETWDCGLGGHFGYAYISARCDAFQLQTQTCTQNGAVQIGAPEGFSYKWFPSGQTTQVINVYNASPGDSVSVQLTSVNGCKTTLGTRIYPTIAKANFIPSPAVVCLKTPISFADSSWSLYTGNNSIVPVTAWNWKFGDGGVSAVQNPVHIYSLAGTYMVTLIITNQNGCTDSIQKTVKVMPGPIAAFGMNPVCVNSTVPFTDSSYTVGTGQTITNWLWTFTDNNMASILQNPSHVYNTPGTYTIDLTVTTNNGCTSDTARTIKIWPLPKANFGATDVCVGDPTQFTDKSVKSDPSDNIVNWIWNFGDTTALSSSQNPGHVYLYPGTYAVQLIIGTGRGCVKDTTIHIVVHPLPKANFSATPLCKGAPVQFHDLSMPTGTIISWKWNFGDLTNNTSTLSAPTHVYDSSMVYYPSLLITSQYGCKDSVRIAVNILPPPEVAFDANKYTGCSPLCVNFIDLTYSASDPVTSWHWTFGDGSTSSLQTPSHCYPNPGLYSVGLAVATANSCTQTASWPGMIDVYPHPQAGFNANPMVTNESAPLIQFADNSIGAAYWRWTFGDFTGATVQDTSHLYEKAGSYLVWQFVKNKFGCVDSISKEIIINPEWTFYVPNCFTPHSSPGVNDGFIGVGTNISDFEMWIFDRWGNNIYHCNDQNQPWNGSVNNGVNGEKTAQEDVYVWKIRLKDVFGFSHNYIGIVSLIR
jgi:PKD repeat protein